MHSSEKNQPSSTMGKGFQACGFCPMVLKVPDHAGRPLKEEKPP